MWELTIDGALNVFTVESLEDLLRAIVANRNAYGLSVREIYSIRDINNTVQLCVCEYPGDSAEVRSSPYVRDLCRVYVDGAIEAPEYLRQEFERARSSGSGSTSGSPGQLAGGPAPASEQLSAPEDTPQPPLTGAVAKPSTGHSSPRAVRILLGYSGSTPPDGSTVRAIVNAVWTGGLDEGTKTSTHPIASQYWSDDADLAVAWKALLLNLQHRGGERAYRGDRHVKALRGHIAETGMRFYVEIYYE